MYIISKRSQVIRIKWLSIIKDETSFFREINYFSKYSSKNKFKMARMKSRKKHFLCKLSRLVIHSIRVIFFNKYPQIPPSSSYLFPVSYKSFAQNIFLSILIKKCLTPPPFPPLGHKIHFKCFST